MGYIARTGWALGAAFAIAGPASAAFVTPIAATIDNQSYISTDGKFLDLLDEETDAWLLVPEAFNTLTGLSYVSNDGDFAAIGQQFNADWISADAGTIDFNVDGITSPKVTNVGFRAGNPFGTIPYAELTYRFTANSDAILSVFYEFSGDFLIPSGANVNTCNCGGIELFDVTHGYYIGDSLLGPLDDIFELEAGDTYIMAFDMGVQIIPQGTPPTPGSYSISAKNHIDFAITARPVVTPPDPGTLLPEPSNWALMLAGFAAVGAVLRRRHVGTARFA